MDFEYRYTEEQQRLRNEVAGRLDAGLAALVGEPVPGSGAARALRRKLGKAGWLVPTLSTKYGGAGLSPDLETALFDEIYARGLDHVLDRRSNALYDTLDRWGTPEQRRRWLPDVAAGASIAVPALAANPDLDPDEVTVEAALRDGEWALDGVQRFRSAEPSPDYAWLLAQNAGRGLVMLLAPLPWPGVTVRATDSAAADCVAVIDFDGVRLPAPYAIGEPGQGWEMALGAMFAFDPARSPQGSDALLAELLDWARGAETGPGAVEDDAPPRASDRRARRPPRSSACSGRACGGPSTPARTPATSRPSIRCKPSGPRRNSPMQPARSSDPARSPSPSSPRSNAAP